MVSKSMTGKSNGLGRVAPEAGVSANNREHFRLRAAGNEFGPEQSVQWNTARSRQ